MKMLTNISRQGLPEVREYFSDDSARDYDSYYAQVADAAEMGDQDAIEEMCGEFGDEEW